MIVSVLGRTILVAVGLSVGLGLAEAGARLVLDIYQADERLGWTFTPSKVGFKFSRAGEFAHTVRFNSHGLRDAREIGDRGPAVERVLTLGDSFVAGLQVRREETFQHLLEKRLNESTGQDIEVINAGIDGYGSAQAIALYDAIGQQYGAKVVVLGLFPLNDVSDNSLEAGPLQHWLSYTRGRPYYILEGKSLERYWRRGSTAYDLEGPLSRLLRRSILYATFSPLPPNISEVIPFRHGDIYQEEYPPSLSQAWAVTRALLNRLRDRVEQEGAKLVIALIPESGAVVGDNELDALRDTLRDDDGHAVVDLEDALERSWNQDREPLYFERDPHWNSRGHEVVANSLALWIQSHRAGLPLEPSTAVKIDRARR